MIRIQMLHHQPNNHKNPVYTAATFTVVTAFLCCCFLFASFADQASDAPVIVPKTTEAAAEASSSDLIDDATSDEPVITPGKKNGKGGAEISGDPKIETSAANTKETTKKSQEINETAKKQEETKAPASGTDQVQTGEAPINVENAIKGGEINSAPVTTTAVTTAAKAPVETTAETTAAPKQTTAVGPGTVKNTGGSAGSIHAGDAASTIDLGFTLISPTHVKSGLKVARAAVSLSSGGWQELGYKDNVRYPYYMYSDQKLDSSGINWYIAKVYARRFGDATSDDGNYKFSLWMNAADCRLSGSITVPTTNQTRLAIVKAALSLIGRQYVYGGNGPDAFDCSGLTKYVYKQAGLTIPRTSSQLMDMECQISAAELRPGDIMVRSGHAGIYIGGDIFVHASDSSVGVVAENLSIYNQSNKFTNFLNIVGD